MKTKLVKILAVALALGPVSAFAATIDILWYTGGVGTTSSFGGGPAGYQAGILDLAAKEMNPLYNVSGSINTWNVTFWSGGAMPGGSFDVLVAASPEGGWSPYPSYAALLASPAGAPASTAYGDRVMLTGQDADWHYLNYPGTANFNGPGGFLIDAINWAGSGTGMGGVFLGADAAVASIFPTSGPLNYNSSNTVVIPGPMASFPINSGLTSAGLSNWSTSSHREFLGFDTDDWTAINVDGAGNAITIVSKATAGGGTSVPDSGSTSVLTLLALGLVGAARRFLGKRA